MKTISIHAKVSGLLFAIFFLGLSCSPPTAPLDQEIEFEKGDVYQIEGSRIRLEFVGAGTAHATDGTVIDDARFIVSEGSRTTEIYLENSSPEAAETVYGDYRITLDWAYGYTQSCGIVISQIAE
ncbi:MAG: hypothetical protein AB8G95_16430 [Anaerolineae bacterium]